MDLQWTSIGCDQNVLDNDDMFIHVRNMEPRDLCYRNAAKYKNFGTQELRKCMQHD